MMIKLSNRHLLSHKNGYFVIYEERVAGSDTVEAGKVTLHIKGTFHRLLDAHKRLVELGECGNKAMHIYQELMLERQKEAGRSVLKARAKKLKESVK